MSMIFNDEDLRVGDIVKITLRDRSRLIDYAFGVVAGYDTNTQHHIVSMYEDVEFPPTFPLKTVFHPDYMNHARIDEIPQKIFEQMSTKEMLTLLNHQRNQERIANETPT